MSSDFLTGVPTEILEENFRKGQMNIWALRTNIEDTFMLDQQQEHSSESLNYQGLSTKLETLTLENNDGSQDHLQKIKGFMFLF